MADQRTRVLVITKGHPFEADPFFAMFEDNPAIAWTHVEQPDAQALCNPRAAAPWDVLVFYDMPGMVFRRSDPPVQFVDPPDEYRRGFHELLASGKGLVFLHHAIAGWPTWPDYAEIVGGRFHYEPGSLRGIEYPASGYHFDVTHDLTVVAPQHPVVRGLPPTFTVTDEVYLSPVFEDDVVPLLTSSAPTTDRHFYAADLAIRGRRGEREGWSHPGGSNLAAWVKHAGRSPVVYLQPGDRPVVYADPNYRRLLANAIDWAASPEAAAWAGARAQRTVTD